MPGYNQYFSSAEKKGYAGTALFSKNKPLQIINYIFSEDKWADGEIYKVDHEGRVIAAEYADFWFVCVYTPNAQNELARLDVRMLWDVRFKEFCKELEAGKHGTKKPVIMCGDMNVAHNEIDIKNAAANRGKAGFSDEERDDFTQLLASGFVDTFRFQNPDLKGQYSWWSYRFGARERNAGWRIDYFLVSESAKKNIQKAKIHQDIYGSDHCPVSLQIKF